MRRSGAHKYKLTAYGKLASNRAPLAELLAPKLSGSPQARLMIMFSNISPLSFAVSLVGRVYAG
jgi:hypothetical protein